MCIWVDGHQSIFIGFFESIKLCVDSCYGMDDPNLETMYWPWHMYVFKIIGSWSWGWQHSSYSRHHHHKLFFPECVARVPVSLWGSGGWGCVRSTLRLWSQPSATVRAIPVWPCLWEVLQRWSFLEVSDVWLLRFAWQAWHFVTFRRVLERVESRFAWQAQYFCDVFRRCVAVFVAGAALWTCPPSFFVAGAELYFRRAVLRVFANRIGRAASSGDKVQIPWQSWHFARCAEKLTEASHETLILRLQIFRF